MLKRAKHREPVTRGVGVISSWSEARRLRRHGGEEAVRRFVSQTRGRLSAPRGVPVVIAARNEEQDLPTTLVALARSKRPVQVWVVVNGTSDRTATFAEEMGAGVLECPTPSKMAALHMAVRHVTREGTPGPILFTDADTLVGPHWAGSFERAARANGRPVVAIGNALFTHGDSLLADTTRNARKLLKARMAERHGRPAVPQGANLAIDFAGSAAALESYLSISGQRFIGEEEEIVQRILAAGGEWRNALNWDVTVLTRGDRFGLADLWRLRNDHDYSIRSTRYAEYGEFQPFGPQGQASPPQPPEEGGRRGGVGGVQGEVA